MMLFWIYLRTGEYYNWRKRQDQEDQHNGLIPKSHWILPWEREAIIDYRYQHLEEGYMRLSYMMLDEDAVSVSPSTVYRVLKSCSNAPG